MANEEGVEEGGKEGGGGGGEIWGQGRRERERARVERRVQGEKGEREEGEFEQNERVRRTVEQKGVQRWGWQRKKSIRRHQYAHQEHKHIRQDSTSAGPGQGCPKHAMYEIDHCTVLGPCSDRGITPSRLRSQGRQGTISKLLADSGHISQVDNAFSVLFAFKTTRHRLAAVQVKLVRLHFLACMQCSDSCPMS